MNLSVIASELTIITSRPVSRHQGQIFYVFLSPFVYYLCCLFLFNIITKERLLTFFTPVMEEGTACLFLADGPLQKLTKWNGSFLLLPLTLPLLLNSNLPPLPTWQV